MLRYREYEPHPTLLPYVQCFWSFLADPPGGVNIDHRVLPDGCIDIVFIARSFDAGAPCDLRAVGTMTRFVEVEAMPLTLGVRFRPGMARPFLATPAGELTDLQIDLSDLWGRDAERLHEQMSGSRSVEARLDLVESALLQRARSACVDRRIAAVVDQIAQAGGQGRLAGVADRIGMSERQLRRRFEDAVGLSPKRFARVVRFRDLLELVRANRTDNAPLDWASTAADHGYYDQAHLIHEFRDFTGQTPTEYVGRIQSA